MDLESFFQENQKYIKRLIDEKRELFHIYDKALIYKVTPNSIHRLIEWKKKPIIEAMFYSSNRIAEKLFSNYTFHPFSNKPLYFNSKTFNPAAGERQGRRVADGSWAAARGAASSGADSAVSELGSALITGQYYNYRLFQPFLTSSLGSNSQITASTWQGYRDDVQEDGSNNFQNTDSTSAEIVVSTEADPTSYAASDYSNVTFTSKGSLAFSSVGSNNTYSTITITDQTIISTTGYTKLAIITGLDLNNNAPTGLNFYTVQNRSQSNPPILTVTYTPAGTFFAIL